MPNILDHPIRHDQELGWRMGRPERARGLLDLVANARFDPNGREILADEVGSMPIKKPLHSESSPQSDKPQDLASQITTSLRNLSRALGELKYVAQEISRLEEVLEETDNQVQTSISNLLKVATQLETSLQTLPPGYSSRPAPMQFAIGPVPQQDDLARLAAELGVALGPLPQDQG